DQLLTAFTMTNAGGLDTYTAKSNAYVGSETISVTASLADGAGNTGNAAPTSLTIDTTAPTAYVVSIALSADTGTSQIDFITKTSAQTVTGTYTGTLDSDETIQVSLDGVTWTDASANSSDHTWSLSGVVLTGTTGSLDVRTADTAGNVNTGATHAYTLDVAAPTAIASITALGTDNGSLNNDFVTNVALQTVSGSYTGILGDGEIIQVSSNGTTWLDATNGPSAWTADNVTLNADGVLNVRTVDLAGNTTSGNNQSYTLDTSAPTASATVTALSAETGASGSFTTSNSAQTVTGTYTNALLAGEGIQVSADAGTTWVVATANSNLGTWSASGVVLGSTGHLTVQTIDLAGNSLNGTGHDYVLDTTAPTALATVVSLSADTSNGNRGTDTDFITQTASQTVSGTFTGTLAMGEKIQVSADNGTNWIDAVPNVTDNTWSASSVTLVTGSSNGLTVRTIDAAANTAAGTPHAYTLDTTVAAPTVALTTDSGQSSADNITNIGTLTVTAEDGANVEYSTTSTDGLNGTWTPTYTATPNASNTVYVRQTDVADNVSTGTSFTFTLDTTAPTPTVFNHTTGANVSSNEAGIAGLYDSSSNLIANLTTTPLVANTSNTVDVAAQSTVTVATLQVHDVAGNLAVNNAQVTLGTTGDDQISVNGQAAAYGFGGNDTFTATSYDILGTTVGKIDGGDGIDTIDFGTVSNLSNFNSLFTNVTNVEHVQLEGASSINVGSTMSTAGIVTILTGNDNTAIKYDGATTPITVDATALVDGKTLTLTENGSSNFVVTNLKGDVQASSLSGAITVTAAAGTGFGVNITTGSGNDTLTGSAGNDVINAGNGTNSITGGRGADTLTGGTGVDTFKFAAGDATAFAFVNTFDSVISTGDTFTFAGGTDVITNFAQGIDKLSVAGANKNGVAYVNEGTTNFANGLTSGNLFLVHGNYDTTNNTFSVSSGGSSTLAIYNVGSGSEGIVLTGVTNLVSSDLVAA
ncbi:Ig-like domain-containing protein, partial [Pseudomonas sp. CCI1.2]|uniref:beta strand repeat-containing protein n=1 Tax=Pseudomonas sp. CCI1.2 TaxID=3048614 RepID=UPI002B222906